MLCKESNQQNISYDRKFHQHASENLERTRFICHKVYVQLRCAISK